MVWIDGPDEVNSAEGFDEKHLIENRPFVSVSSKVANQPIWNIKRSSTCRVVKARIVKSAASEVFDSGSTDSVCRSLPCGSHLRHGSLTCNVFLVRTLLDLRISNERHA